MKDYILVKIVGKWDEETGRRKTAYTRIPGELTASQRYKSLEEVPDEILSQAHLGDLTPDEVDWVNVLRDEEPEWNRCPVCKWPHLTQGVVAEEAIVSDGPHDFYHEPEEWIAPLYLRCGINCGWKHEYGLTPDGKWPSIIELMVGLHIKAEKENRSLVA